MTFYYDCPNIDCGALIEIDEHDDRVRCPSCHVFLQVDTDGEIGESGLWHDLTRLIPVLK
jgi:hypothetical protein